MRIRLIVVGKTKKDFIKVGEQFYLQRLLSFCRIEQVVVRSWSELKGQSQAKIKEKEGQEILAKMGSDDLLIVWDEQGQQLSSVELAGKIEKVFAQGREVVMVVGGAFGLSTQVKKRADHIWSLSALTFTHEMARLLVLEQLYRAMTIIKGVPYHY